MWRCGERRCGGVVDEVTVRGVWECVKCERMGMVIR